VDVSKEHILTGRFALRSVDPSKPATAWFDDLKIYVNGEQVLQDNFSNWTPYLVGGTLIGGVAGARYADVI